jgi:hypothetical protein
MRKIPKLTDVDIKKFETRFIRSKGCWNWIGFTRSDGYGYFYLKSEKPKVEQFYAHRVAFVHYKNIDIPWPLCIDHLCRNRKCVNPDHMELVTQQENTLRGISPFAVNRRKTHCRRNHPLKGKNLYVYKGGRHCRKCIAFSQKRTVVDY